MSVLTLVPLVPFPKIPGADELDVPVAASGRGGAEPLLFTAALEDLLRDAGTSVRPLRWHETLETDRQARLDLADAFAREGLRHFTVDTDLGSRSKWTLGGKSTSLAAVSKRFWPPFLAAVVRGLDAQQEMARDALPRIRAVLEERREAQAQKRAADTLDYLQRSSWSVPVALQWIAKRDLGSALESVAALHGDRADWSLMSDIETLMAAQDLGVSTDLNVSSPFSVLLRACITRPGMLIGRAAEQPDFAPIDVRHLELGTLRFEGASYDRARSGDVTWTGVCVDRRLLLDAFPAPAVIVTEFVLTALRRVPASALADAALASRSPGRPLVKRAAAKQIIRELWGPDGPPPKLLTVNAKLKARKGEVKDVSRETYDVALKEVRSERTENPGNAREAE